MTYTFTIPMLVISETLYEILLVFIIVAIAVAIYKLIASLLVGG